MHFIPPEIQGAVGAGSGKVDADGDPCAEDHGLEAGPEDVEGAAGIRGGNPSCDDSGGGVACHVVVTVRWQGNGE